MILNADTHTNTQTNKYCTPVTQAREIIHQNWIVYNAYVTTLVACENISNTKIIYIQVKS